MKVTNPSLSIKMPLYKPSDLQDYLSSLGIKPKKGLSQNFLIDGNIIRKIVALADVQPGDLVIEIGPGPGALSEAIVEAGATLIAVEADKTLAKGLERLPNTTIYNEDALKFPFEEVITRKAKVIANLPYHITSPILARLVPLHEKISTVTVMVQDEVGRRMCADAGEKDYGHFSLFLRFYSDPSYGFKVSNQCFYPPPKIQSAVVQLALKKPPLEDPEPFFKMTRMAFSQRRKMLRSSLGKVYAVDRQERPEQLSLEQFLELFRNLSQ